MKKRALFGLLIALAVCSCQIKEDGEFASEGKVFTATMESMVDDEAAVETKTSMDASGNVRWKRGDQVSIFVGSTINQHFQVTDASDGKTAAALNQVESPGFVAGSEIVNNVAFYPYAATAEIAKNGNSYVLSDIALPATQYYANASFGNGAFPMTAVTSSKSDYNLKFKNVLGGLKLQLKGTGTIASISVTGNNNEKLCGAAEVTVSGDNAPAITLTDASAKTVTLDCGDGVQLDANTATAYIIALPPMTMSGGFTAIVTDTEGATMEIKTTKTQTITRSSLLKMPELSYVGTVPVLTPVPEAVDLGLPSGLKWASFNVGANAPEEYGDYFAWGEVEPYYSSQDPLTWKDGKEAGYTYTWASYKFRTSGNSSDNVKLSKYVIDSSYGTVDNNTILKPEDDAACVNWGATWRMPTAAEWDELKNECTWTRTTQDGTNGYLVTGSNNNSIFLPAAGSWGDNGLDNNVGSGGCYWSSSLYGTTNARCVYLNTQRYFTNSERVPGYSVRPVSDKGVRVAVEDVIMNKSLLNLAEGGSFTLTAIVTPSNATQPTVIWSSSNISVAKVDYNGNVVGIAKGTATITVTTYDNSHTATCKVTVDNFVPDAVDLGLPSSLKWASFNIGAAEPEQCGDYYAWGEIEPYYPAGHSQDYYCTEWKDGKTGYNWKSYKWCNGTSDSLNKYGKVDNRIVLEEDDDVAHYRLGSGWRMPTDAEWTELREKCTWTWSIRSGINGYLVTGPNGNSIFLPAGGPSGNTGWVSSVPLGLYWSSSLCSGNNPYAWCVVFNYNDARRDNEQRCRGFFIRSVKE